MGGYFDIETAERIIESLRFGIPPRDVIRDFTVGREDEIQRLQNTLSARSDRGGNALLINANYGSGKSHLLQVLRKIALDSGYAVSLVVVNPQGGVRFNRMDDILGEVSSRLESTGAGKTGIGPLFDAFFGASSNELDAKANELRDHILGDQWNHRGGLRSPAMRVALRAWPVVAKEVKDLIEDWFSNPYNYRSQRKPLYQKLVSPFLEGSPEDRTEQQFYAEEVFVFHTQDHRQAWDAISDLDIISRAAGFRGLALLFDEFEHVVQNLNRRDLQKRAYANLFRFLAGERYSGMAYFAVTPDFIEKMHI